LLHGRVEEVGRQLDAEPVAEPVATGFTFAESWAATDDRTARRQLLGSALAEVRVVRSGRRGKTDVRDRAELVWRQEDWSTAAEGESSGPAVSS